MFAAIRRPLVALMLGLLPFVLFAGLKNTARVNGVVVQDDQLNIIGLVLAFTGIVLAVTSMRSRSAFDGLRRSIAAVAVLVCLVQIPISAGLFSPPRFLASMRPGADLPALVYKGLDEQNRRIPNGILAKNDPDQTRRAIVNYKVSMMDNAHQHIAYADLCHEGRYRIRIEAVEALPEFLTAKDRETFTRLVEGARRSPPDKCSESRTRYAMGELVDAINRVADIVQVLIDGYPAQISKAKP